jgi:N-acetylglucosamine-6-phosphate deacetylase
MSEPVLLANGSVLIDGKFAAVDIFIADGKIEGIFPRDEPARGAAAEASAAGASAMRGISPNAASIDLGGKRVLPGFIDVHTHGGAGVDFNHTSSDDVWEVMRFFSSRGVTSCLPTVLADSPEIMARQLALIADPALMAECPQILGIHLEGPFLCSKYKGAQPEQYLRGCDKGLFDELQRSARGNIRLMTMSPELDGAISFIANVVAGGVRVSIGHSAASYEQAMAAIEAGASSVTHIMNAMKLLHMHDPAILTAALESDAYAEMICDGFHLYPPIVRLLLKVKGLDRMIAMTDSIMAAGLSDGRYILGVNDVAVEGGDAKLVSNGMRAGSTLTMIDAVRNIRKFTGLGLESISKLVSENPAKMLGIFGETGSIAEGKRADLVVLDSTMNVAMTMARGNVVYP